MKQFLIFLVFFSPFFCSKSWALKPVESLVLGDFSGEYSESISDPLDFVFNRENNLNEKNVEDFKKDLALYRGMYEEGRNLSDSCKKSTSFQYSSEWDKLQVMRSMMAEVQYIGLDLSVRALPQYAKFFEFTNEEFSNLVEDLVGNYCSTNISVISKKELKNNLMLKFNKENTFVLPSIEGNPLFPENMSKYVPIKKAREQEFKYTVKLFQSLCSWNGDPNTPGLMLPLVKHPAIMAFINRQMNSKEIEWDKNKNKLFLIDSNKTVHVWCDNLICRKTFKENFINKIIYSVGGTNFMNDVKNLYCSEFQLLDYDSKGVDNRIAKIMNARSFDEDNFIQSQFLALLTGVPDFLLGLDRFKEGEDMLRSNIDYTWSNWAKTQSNNLTRDLYFEEPLTLDLNDRKLYFNKDLPELKVAFDVNLGEFDKINQMVGKLKMSFTINVNKSYLRFHKNALKSIENDYEAQKDRLINRLKLQFEKDTNYARQLLIIPPWKGDLAYLIAREVSEEINMQDDKFYNYDDVGNKDIKVEIYYSPFALMYLNHQHVIKSKETPSKPMTKSTFSDTLLPR